jgi:hypothetical protein
MKKNSSALIATLTLTAIVLGVILLATPSRPVQAAMANNQGSVVLITSGQSSGADDSLFIIDKGSGKMLVYQLTNGQFELSGNADIAALFSRTSPR